MARKDSRTTLATDARTRVAGASTLSWSASASAATSQFHPSCIRPRDNQSGSSADASVSARSVSEFSRLHAKAARRLSISVCRLFDAPIVLSADRRVEQAGHRGVVVAMTGADVVAFAGLVELFLCVLTDGFEQPVAGAVRGVVGDHERLVDQQGELVEHVVALRLVAGHGLGCAASRSNPP